MDINTIGPLLVVDMKERLVTITCEVGDANQSLLEDIIEQIARCKTMSDINILLCNYHYLFSDEKDQGKSVVSVDGTQEYVIGLLTKRIVNDKKIIHNWNEAYDNNEWIEYLEDKEELDAFYFDDPGVSKMGTQTKLGDSTDWDQLSRDNTNSSGHPADWSDCGNCGEIDLHLDEQCPDCGRSAI